MLDNRFINGSHYKFGVSKLLFLYFILYYIILAVYYYFILFYSGFLEQTTKSNSLLVKMT